jgi:hypothetical protein
MIGADIEAFDIVTDDDEDVGLAFRRLRLRLARVCWQGSDQHYSG